MQLFKRLIYEPFSWFRTWLLHNNKDEGARWSSVDDIISTAFDVKGKADDSVDEGKDTLTSVDESVAKRASFSIYLSKAMLHLARAASRASCGRFWLKVGIKSGSSEIASSHVRIKATQATCTLLLLFKQCS